MNHYLKREVSDSDMMSTIRSYDHDGYDLVTCTLICDRKFSVSEFYHHESPPIFLLIFKRAV